MSKKDNKSAAMPKKTDSLTYMIYATFAVIILAIAATLGAALDLCVTKNGKMDMSKFETAMNKVSADKALIFHSLTTGGYALKVAFLAIVVVGLFAAYKVTSDTKRFHRKGVEHGSAQWGDNAEIQALADKRKAEFFPIRDKDGKRVFDENGNFVGVMIDNNILFSKEVKLSLDAKQHLLNHNSLIIGGSGAGKTRFYALPNIMQLNTSYVVTDPKGEILQATGKMLEQAGYRVVVFNTIQMEHSSNYNPFHYVFDHNGKFNEDNVLKMVDVLFSSTKGDGEKEDFWSQKGKTMLEAIVFLLFSESEYNAEFDDNGEIIESTRDHSHLNFFAVTEKMRKLQYPPKGSQKPDGFFMDRYEDESDDEYYERRSQGFLCPLDKDFIELERRKGDCLAVRLYKEVRNAPEETGQSFLSSANVKTFVYNLENLKNLTCTDTINLEKLGDEKTALFILVSATDGTYNFLAAMMYKQLFDTLSDRANFKYGGELPIKVRCIMDEFANIGAIPDFEKIVAFVRSMGVSLNIIVQNLGQLKSKYEKTWEIITGNCDTTMFLGGKEESTLKSISETLGKETIDIKSANRTRGRQSSTSENNSIVGRELMQINEVQTIPIDRCVIMMRSHNPFYCHKYPLEQHPNYKFTGKYDDKNNYDISQVHSIKVTDLIKENKTSDGVKKKLDSKFVVELSKEVTCDTTEQIIQDAMEQLLSVSEVYNKSGDEVGFGVATSVFDSIDLQASPQKEAYIYEKQVEDTTSHSRKEEVTEEVVFSEQPTVIFESAELGSETIKGAELNTADFNDETMKAFADQAYEYGSLEEYSFSPDEEF